MKEPKTQEERLDWLVDRFKAEDMGYMSIPTPAAAEGKRTLLRSMMNVRMPKSLPEEVRAVQDAYLRREALMKGIVSVDSLQPCTLDDRL